MSNFKHDYIEYDELGAKFIKCFMCGSEIVRRGYKEIRIPSAPPRTEKILTMNKLAHFNQERISLEDGSVSDIYICKGCKPHFKADIETDPDTSEKIRSQLERAEILEKKQLRRDSIDEIKKTNSTWKKLRVMKKLDIEKTLEESHKDSVRIVKEFKKKKEKSRVGNI